MPVWAANPSIESPVRNRLIAIVRQTKSSVLVHVNSRARSIYGRFGFQQAVYPADNEGGGSLYMVKSISNAPLDGRHAGDRRNTIQLYRAAFAYCDATTHLPGHLISMNRDLISVCEKLCQASSQLERPGQNLDWPEQQMRWLAEAGVFGWFVPAPYELFPGAYRNERQQLDGYLAISQACLTTAFVLTQWNAACKRIASCSNEIAKRRWLPGLARGELFATVGISHLTTSRQHLGVPVLSARPDDLGGYRLDGYSPWVTGAAHADVLVVGATLPSVDPVQQILCAIPMDRPGIVAGPGTRLMALSASQTDMVRFDSVQVEPQELLAGPMPDVMQAGMGGGAGGLQTSTLAIGLTMAAVEFLKRESRGRSELSRIADKLAADCRMLQSDLWTLVEKGLSAGVTPGKLRERANSLVLRATQAALGAAKGAGFVAEHPAGRWCREALFFLVWSCPHGVLTSNLCEFAQV